MDGVWVLLNVRCRRSSQGRARLARLASKIPVSEGNPNPEAVLGVLGVDLTTSMYLSSRPRIMDMALFLPAPVSGL